MGKRKDWIDRVVDKMFTTGNGQVADRLVLTDGHGNGMGGWGKEPMASFIRAHRPSKSHAKKKARKR